MATHLAPPIAFSVDIVEHPRMIGTARGSRARRSTAPNEECVSWFPFFWLTATVSADPSIGGWVPNFSVRVWAGTAPNERARGGGRVWEAMPARETRREAELEWEPIPDDVLVPRRDGRDRFARPFPPDVQVVRRRNVGVDAVDADRRSVPRARGKRRRRAVVDDVHDAHDAAAPVAVAGWDDSPDPDAVLAAHLSSGWSLRRESDGDGRTSLVPPRDGARGAPNEPANDADRGTTSELLVLRRAYGIDPPGAPRSLESSSKPTFAPSDAAFASLSAAVSCARLCAAVLRRRDWCVTAVDAAHSAAGAFRREVARMRRDGTLGRNPGVVKTGRSVEMAPEDEMAATVRAALAGAKVALEEGGGGVGRGGGRKEKSGGDRGDGIDPFAAAMAAMGGVGGGFGKSIEPVDRTRRETEPADETLDSPAAVAVAVALDDAMYAMAYHHRSCGWTSAGSWWPNPAAYLAAVTASHRPGASVSTIASAVTDDVLEGAEEWEWLEAIRRSRTAEATALLTATGAVTAADVLAAGRKAAASVAKRGPTRGRGAGKGDGTPPPPPCPKLVQLWRDGARVWPCRLFAFAAPTRRALRALRDASVSWVEVGAGLGYWAFAMESAFGMDVVALDKTPGTGGFGGDSPTGDDGRNEVETEGEMNEYHGRAASFVKVREGGPRDLRRHKTRALFLCYPPPGDDMAARSIREHGGDVVAVVGEWDGNTGDAALARELRESWNLARRVSLPQWGDTAHELTIWRRKTDSTERGGAGAETRASAFAACRTCGAGDHERELRRCVYCRVVCFCSEKCSRDGDATRAHSEEHVLRDLAWTAPAYFDEASFRVFSPCGG